MISQSGLASPIGIHWTLREHIDEAVEAHGAQIPRFVVARRRAAGSRPIVAVESMRTLMLTKSSCDLCQDTFAVFVGELVARNLLSAIEINPFMSP